MFSLQCRVLDLSTFGIACSICVYHRLNETLFTFEQPLISTTTDNTQTFYLRKNDVFIIYIK